MSLAEQLGRATGWLVGAPVATTLAALRRSRPVHPRGVLFEGTILAEANSTIGRAVTGPALVRLSHAMWKRPRPHLPDVLGCAVRIAGEQDLLFATIKRPWTMPFAPFTTNVDDAFDNLYFGVSPFRLSGIEGRFYLRLRPFRNAGLGGFVLQAAPRPRRGYQDVARIALVRIEEGGGKKLHFDPFRTGRGIEPCGFIHGLRRGAYAASQRTRSLFEAA